jgi:hypothetical protein
MTQGYPVDLANTERPYVQEKITGKSFTQCSGSLGPGSTGPITTDADAQGGQSGGPLWLLPEADGVRYLYGVLSAGNAQETMFAGRTTFVNAVAQARAQFP